MSAGLRFDVGLLASSCSWLEGRILIGKLDPQLRPSRNGIGMDWEYPIP